MKKIIKACKNDKKYSSVKLELLLSQMQLDLLEKDKQGYKINQIDETILNGQETIKKAQSNINKNVVLKQFSAHNKTVAVLGAIQSNDGNIFTQQKQRYFKNDELIYFLKELKRRNCGKQIAIFLDNSSVHHAKKVKEFCNIINLPLIYNIPYSPWYNGIEKIWAIWKQVYRKKNHIIESK